MEKLSLKEENQINLEIELESKSKGKAYQHLLTLGVFGSHWFYLGNKSRGFIELFLGILSVLWVIFVFPLLYLAFGMALTDSGEPITLAAIPTLMIMLLIFLGPISFLLFCLILDFLKMNNYIEKLNKDIQDSVIIDYIITHRDIRKIGTSNIDNPITKTKITPEFIEQHFINLEVRKESKDKTIAYRLLLLFGIFGSHWFYLGNKIRGSIQLSMFILGVTLVKSVSHLRWVAYFDRKNTNLMSDTYFGLSSYELFLKSVSVFGYMTIVILVIWLIMDFFKLSKYIDSINSNIRTHVTKNYMLNNKS